MSLFISCAESAALSHHAKGLESNENYEMDVCVDDESLDFDSSINSPLAMDREFPSKPTFLDNQLSKLSDNLREIPKPSVSYRTELKRPDLKGMSPSYRQEM